MAAERWGGAPPRRSARAQAAVDAAVAETFAARALPVRDAVARWAHATPDRTALIIARSSPSAERTLAAARCAAAVCTAAYAVVCWHGWWWSWPLAALCAAVAAVQGARARRGVSAADFVVTAEWDRVTYAEVAANLSAYVDGDDGGGATARAAAEHLKCVKPMLGTARAAHHGGDAEALMAADGWASLGLTPADVVQALCHGGRAVVLPPELCGPRADASRAPDVAVAVHHLINRFDILEVSAGARFWDAMSAVAPPDALRNVPVRLRR